MQTPISDTNVVTLRAQIRPDAKIHFIEWQGHLNEAITGYPGFISLEILTPSNILSGEWVIVQRFQDKASILKWRQSPEHERLYNDLKALTVDSDPNAIQEEMTTTSNINAGVTEVFVTEISPNSEKQYREWLAKIHKVEASFPGFKGMYVQSPSQNRGKNWITFLQFDTQANLDKWLDSPERKEVLKGAQPLISSLESHRVISPFAGWFSSVAQKGTLPPAWKQGMIVLLVLFPIVMLEFKFLNPLLKGLNTSLATFIGNSISVGLVTWPTVPFAISCLKWWLVPDPQNSSRDSILGTLLVLALYVAEIALFWNLL